MPAHQCRCAKCQQPDSNQTKELHAQLNLFLTSLPKEQRCWFLGKESMNPNYGGDQALEVITGVSAVVIAKTRWALQLAECNRWSVSHFPRQTGVGIKTTVIYEVQPQPDFVKSKRKPHAK